MAKVEMTLTSVVCVEIKGEGKDGVPKVREDNGVVRHFQKFMLDNDIYPAIQGGHAGAGSFCGFFYPEDVERIKPWLVKQGVIETTD